MAQKLLLSKDQNGNVTYGIPFPKLSFSSLLPTGVELTFTVPDGVNFVIFSFNPGGVWVADSTSTLSLPATPFAPTNGELNPGSRAVSAGDTLRFITANTGDTEVGITFWDLTG